MARTASDAAGRLIRPGDVVGGTTLNRPATITGKITEVGLNRVLVLIETSTTTDYKHTPPKAGTELWLPTARTFLIYGAQRTTQVWASSITSLPWTGRAADLTAVARFVGGDLVGAVADKEGAVSLLLRTQKNGQLPELVPPGWFIMRPPGRGRHRACDPHHYLTAYTPAPNGSRDA